MAFLDIFRRNNIEPQKEERSYEGLGLQFGTLGGFSTSSALKLSAVFSATNQISNNVALLPAKVYKTKNGKRMEVEHNLNRILNLRPEPSRSHFNFFKGLIESVILRGNGYALIERDDMLNVKALRLINPDMVTRLPQENGSAKYIINGFSTPVDESEIINVHLYTDEMGNGVSVLKYAVKALALANNTNTQADTFFKGGSNLSGIIKASSPLSNEQKKQISQSWNQAFQNNTNSMGVAILPQGLEYQSVSISPEDSQLLEYQKFTVIELARYFNISPVKLFDLSSVSYNSMEFTQIMFLQDCIQPYVEAIENEMNLKLFRPSEVGKYSIDFDFEALMNTNKEALAKYYRELILTGILSIDEVREKLGFTPMDTEASQAHWIQLSYATIDNIASGALTKAQEQSQPSSQSDLLDNKVKTNE